MFHQSEGCQVRWRPRDRAPIGAVGRDVWHSGVQARILREVVREDEPGGLGVGRAEVGLQEPDAAGPWLGADCSASFSA